jgi:2-dehydropantoate 2-reductase
MVSEAVSQGVGQFDYVVLTSKAFLGTNEFIKDVVGENTAIVLVQNGIGIEEEYKKGYPRNTVILGVVYFPTTQVKPGYIEMGPLECLEVGRIQSLTARCSQNKR